MAQDYTVTVTGKVYHHDGSPAAEFPIHYYDPSGPQTVAPIVFYTDTSGIYEYTYDVLEPRPDVCGTLTLESCDGDVIETLICHNPRETAFKNSHRVCYPDTNCYFKLHYEQLDNGEFNVKIEGVTRSDSVLWNTGETTPNIVGQEGRTYCVSVYGSEGCYFEECITIVNEQKCSFRITGAPLVKDGVPTRLKVEPGNNEPLSYLWNTRDTTQSIEVSEGGEYCVRVSFIDGCTSEECIYVEEINNPACSAHIIQEDSVLIGILRDDIQEDVDTQEKISYLWSTGETTSSITPEEKGVYCVIISTSTCRSEACFRYSIPGDCSLEVNYTAIEDGVVLEAVGYGADSIKYMWSTGSNDPEIYVTEDGAYCVRMTTGDGCTASHCVDIKLDSIFQGPCEVFIVEEIDADGNEGFRAIIRNPDNYEFVWSDGTSGAVFFPKESGNYCVKAFSRTANCIAEACIYFLAADDCDLDVKTYNDSRGVIIESIPYGTAPFTYLWSTGSTEASILVTEAGVYSLVVTDANGCIARWRNNIDINNGDPCVLEIIKERIDHGTVLLTALGDYTIGDSIEILWSTGEIGRSIVVTESGSYCATFDSGVACDVAVCIDVRIEESNCDGIIEVIDRGSDTLLVAQVKGEGAYRFKWSTGETTDTILYPGGEVCFYVQFEEGCEIKRCINLDNKNVDKFLIIGNLMDPVTDQIIFPRHLEVFSVNEDSTVGTVGYDYEIADNGKFVIYLRQGGNYIVKAYARDYIPTYYYSSATWQRAETIHVGETTDAPLYNINMIPVDSNNGQGKVGGKVSSDGKTNVDGGFPTRSEEGIPDIQILITDMEGIPLRVAYSDEGGDFIMDNLPFGKYLIHTEIAGIVSEIIEVELSQDNPSIINLELIVPDYLESADQTSSVDELSLINDLKVYPNPLVDLLNIEFNADGISGKGELSIIDVNGKKFHNEIVSIREGHNLLSFSIRSQLPSGIYMVVVKIDTSISTTRVLKY